MIDSETSEERQRRLDLHFETIEGVLRKSECKTAEGRIYVEGGCAAASSGQPSFKFLIEALEPK